MLSKKFLSVILLSATAMSTTAIASDRNFNTIAGAVIGASIGLGTGGGGNGALIGGVLGAAVGNNLSTRSYDQRAYGGRSYGGRSYGGDTYSTRSHNSYYATRGYQPTPVYYEQRTRYQHPSYSSQRRWDGQQHGRGGRDDGRRYQRYDGWR